ncbi:MAG: hypothetical protein IPI97_15345 [Nitrosomonas sp.]|nr:hypothetical protein [Nitrosomonas sp.]
MRNNLRSSSIGLPLVKYMQAKASPLSRVGRSYSMTDSEYHALKKLAPRVLADHMIQVSKSNVTVVMCLCPAISGDFHAQTIFSIWDGANSAKANRIILAKELPVFTTSGFSPDLKERKGAKVSRLDITANFATGSESQARALIRWLSKSQYPE